MLEVISAARTKKAPIPTKAPARKWRATMPRRMSNRKPMPKDRFPKGLEWYALLLHRRPASRTFLSAFSESDGLRRSPCQLRSAAVFNNSHQPLETSKIRQLAGEGTPARSRRSGRSARRDGGTPDGHHDTVRRPLRAPRHRAIGFSSKRACKVPANLVRLRIKGFGA